MAGLSRIDKIIQVWHENEWVLANLRFGWAVGTLYRSGMDALVRRL